MTVTLVSVIAINYNLLPNTWPNNQRPKEKLGNSPIDLVQKSSLRKRVSLKLKWERILHTYETSVHSFNSFQNSSWRGVFEDLVSRTNLYLKPRFWNFQIGCVYTFFSFHQVWQSPNRTSYGLNTRLDPIAKLGLKGRSTDKETMFTHRIVTLYPTKKQLVLKGETEFM